MLEKLLLYFLLFLCGYLLGKFVHFPTNNDLKEKASELRKILKGKNYGAVFKPKTAEELKKEKDKEFYDRI